MPSWMSHSLKFANVCMAALACMLPLSSMAQKGSGSFTLTDDRGRVIVIDKAPQRIITLLPSLGEIVCELQACCREQQEPISKMNGP